MIVVTGMGTVSAAGVGREALVAALARGVPRVSSVDRSGGFHPPDAARTAAMVDQAGLAGLIPPLSARRMSPPSRYAVIAAGAAMQDAGLAISPEPDPGMAVVVATALGPSSYSQKLLDQILDEGPAAVSPSLFSECVPNAPAAQAALACRAQGPSVTIAQSEAGPLRAVARAALELTRGKSRLALAGSVDELSPLIHAILDRFRALARPGAGKPERARPFDRRRDGFLAAEGATMLVLETVDSAQRRGAAVLARLLGAWSAFDPTAGPSAWGCGVETLAVALERGLARHGASPADVNLIVSGASGSIAGDRLEAGVLRRVWSDLPLPPILTPKAVTGEYGAFLGAAILAAGGARIGSEGAFEEIDPELGVVPQTRGVPGEPGCILVTSLAAGGAASWLLLERP